MKIVDDKYYTPIHVANHCWEKVKNIIGLENISQLPTTKGVGLPNSLI